MLNSEQLAELLHDLAHDDVFGIEYELNDHGGVSRFEAQALWMQAHEHLFKDGTE